MTTRSSTLVLTPEQLAAIGSVAVESTYLERHIESLTLRLTKISMEDGEFLVGRLMMDGRLDLLSSIGLPRIKSKKRKTEFTDLIGKLKHSNTDRNTVIHGVWLFDAPPGSIALSSILMASLIIKPGNAKATRKRPNQQPQTLSASKIIKIAETISQLNIDLRQFEWKVWPHLPSLKRLKSPPRNRAQNPVPISKPKGLPSQP